MRIKHFGMAFSIFFLAVAGFGIHNISEPYAGLTGAERLQRNGGNVAIAQTYRREFNEQRTVLGLDRPTAS